MKAALVTDDFAVINSERYAVTPGNSERQETTEWIAGLKQVVPAVVAAVDSGELDSIAVTSTSGTVIPVDEDGAALTQAVMYNATHSTYEEFSSYDYDDYFRPTFTLPKIHWLKQTSEQLYRRTHKFLNPTDFVIGYLTGEYNRTDPTNAYKMGYHPETGWKQAILDDTGIALDKLPHKVVTNTCIGELRPSLAENWCLSRLPVYNGTVDSVANFIAATSNSGTKWSASLGSSLSVKGKVPDFPTLNQFYGYPHPSDGFVLGGHSSVGTQWMIDQYPNQRIGDFLNRIESIDTEHIAYPRAGSEVLPLERDFIPKFISGTPSTQFEAFRSQLKTLLFFEKWIYELIEARGFNVSTVSSTGYLSTFENINKLRASILGRDIQWLDNSYLSTSVGAAAVAKYRAGKLSSLSRFLASDLYKTVTPDNKFEYSERHYEEFKRFFEDDLWHAQQ